MARKKKPASGPGNAYLLSFGDTMTTLLAFFIVLNSLAEDQTGANLHTGTGSFTRAITSFGVSGSFPGNHGRLVAPQNAPMPDYVVPSEDEKAEPDGSATGPDDNPNQLRVIDRNDDDFQRFMAEVARLSEVTKEAPIRDEAIFDYFNGLNRKAPLLTSAYEDMVLMIVPLLRQPANEITIIVWATSPSESAWMKATERAAQIGKEIGDLGNLTDRQRRKIRTAGKPWFDKDAKRPVLSIVVRKH